MNPLARKLVRQIVRSLDGEEGLRRLEAASFHDSGFGFDCFGLEPEFFWAAGLPFRLLYRHWFRVQSTGHEHVPSSGPVIVVSNHSGLLPFDGAMLTIDLMEKLEPPRILRSIVDHFAFAFPYVGLFMQRTGQVSGTARNFAELLARGEMILVFPEGTPAIVKPFRDRYKLRPFRVGFVELAIEHQAPILPCAVVGAEEQAPVLFGSRALGRALGLPLFPVTPTFPLLGPLGLVPYPSRYFVTYGEPIRLHEDYPLQAARDPQILKELAERTRVRVQELINEGLERRGRGNGWSSS